MTVIQQNEIAAIAKVVCDFFGENLRVGWQKPSDTTSKFIYQKELYIPRAKQKELYAIYSQSDKLFGSYVDAVKHQHRPTESQIVKFLNLLSDVIKDHFLNTEDKHLALYHDIVYEGILADLLIKAKIHKRYFKPFVLSPYIHVVINPYGVWASIGLNGKMKQIYIFEEDRTND